MLAEGNVLPDLGPFAGEVDVQLLKEGQGLADGPLCPLTLRTSSVCEKRPEVGVRQVEAVVKVLGPLLRQLLHTVDCLLVSLC